MRVSSAIARQRRRATEPTGSMLWVPNCVAETPQSAVEFAYARPYRWFSIRHGTVYVGPPRGQRHQRGDVTSHGVVACLVDLGAQSARSSWAPFQPTLTFQENAGLVEIASATSAIPERRQRSKTWFERAIALTALTFDAIHARSIQGQS